MSWYISSDDYNMRILHVCKKAPFYAENYSNFCHYCYEKVPKSVYYFWLKNEGFEIYARKGQNEYQVG